MLRTYSENELVEMCKQRGPGYREDILAISTRKPDGNYELDTGSGAYFQLKNKYAAAKFPRNYDPVARSAAERSTVSNEARLTAQGRMKVMVPEDVYHKGPALVETLGAGSEFAFAYAEFLALEKAGRCKNCTRRGQLQKIVTALKTSVLASTVERRRLARDMFAGAIYFELMPAALKWDDLMK